jgi:hypothetical protein
MSDFKKTEEIIELTEVVEETSAAGGKGGGSPFFSPDFPKSPSSDPGEGIRQERKKGEIWEAEAVQALKQDLLSNLKSSGRQSETAPSSPLTESFRSILEAYETEIHNLKEKLNKKAEEWFASEGIQLLEGVAREMFPKIAEEVIEREIAKLKEESEERS